MYADKPQAFDQPYKECLHVTNRNCPPPNFLWKKRMAFPTPCLFIKISYCPEDFSFTHLVTEVNPNKSFAAVS